jgi:hypothetical protein
MSDGCDANTVLTTVIGFSLFIISEILPFLNVKPNGLIDAIGKVLLKYRDRPATDRPATQEPEV